MKIIIASTQVPFISGGAEIQAFSLKDALIREGHEAEIVTIPYPSRTQDILPSIPYMRLLDLSEIHGHKVDRVIGLKFPSYLISHPKKVIWLIHQQRDVYDLWEAGFSSLINEPSGLAIREAVKNIDQIAFREAHQIFAESQTVSHRLKKFNQFDSTPLYHPPRNEEKFYHDKSEGYLFFPSRITALKRQYLVIQALSRTKNPIPLVLAGVSDVPSEIDNIERLIGGLGLQSRVKMLGKISEEEKFSLYAKSLAVIYPPYYEDYGYVTLEAMLSRKPVVTCFDSGGTLEFVENGHTGWIVAPRAQSLADCFDEIWENPSDAERRGMAGRERYEQLGISWKKVVDTLCG